MAPLQLCDAREPIPPRQGRARSRRPIPRSVTATVANSGCANADNAIFPTGRDEAAVSRSAEERLPLLGFVSVKGAFTRPARGAFRPRKCAGNRQSACKPGSVWRETVSRGARDGHSSGTIVADRLWRPTRATARRRACRRSADVSPLFGLAPGGACHARGVAVPAVRSYRTLSPLPRRWPVKGRVAAVCFLWRFPWGRPRRTLSGAVSPWSPDFPLPRGSGHPADWLNNG